METRIYNGEFLMTPAPNQAKQLHAGTVSCEAAASGVVYCYTYTAMLPLSNISTVNA